MIIIFKIDLSKIVDFICNIWPILMLILPFFSMHLHKRVKRWYLKCVLSFRKRAKVCFIAIPKFKSTILRKDRDVAIYDEVALLLHINSLLADAGISIITESNESDIVYDEIQIGGPVTNKFTNRYFKRYLKEITWIVTGAHYERYLADANLNGLDYSFIEKARNKEEGFRFGAKFFSYVPNQKGLAILIKIVDKSGASPRTIHLLFGAGANGTIGAVSFFVNHYADIYKKMGSQPYIGVFAVNGSGAQIEEIEWLDCCDYFR